MKTRSILTSTRGASAVGVVIAILLIAAVAFGAWKYYQGMETPRQSAQKLLDACPAGDMDTIKSRVTDATYKEIMREWGTEDAFVKAVKDVFNLPENLNEGAPVCISDGTPEGADVSLVFVAAKNGRSVFPNLADLHMGLVMVREGGRWRLDTQRTETHDVDEMDRCIRNERRVFDWKLRYQRSKERHGGSGLITLFPFPTR